MRTRSGFCVVLWIGLTAAAPVRAEELRREMESQNARWLAAFNGRHGEAFAPLYAKDAVLLPPGDQPVNGRDAIGKYWADRVKNASLKDHKFEIVSLRRDGNLAYQVARWTVKVVSDNGEAKVVSGNTVRIFERQPDGAWLTKVHIYNAHE